MKNNCHRLFQRARPRKHCARTPFGQGTTAVIAASVPASARQTSRAARTGDTCVSIPVPLASMTTTSPSLQPKERPVWLFFSQTVTVTTSTTTSNAVSRVQIKTLAGVTTRATRYRCRPRLRYRTVVSYPRFHWCVNLSQSHELLCTSRMKIVFLAVVLAQLYYLCIEIVVRFRQDKTPRKRKIAKEQRGY